MSEPTPIPHVSVVIANYNKGSLLCDAVQSALNQDYPNKSICVVDDKSTDNSVDLLLTYLGYTEQLAGQTIMSPIEVVKDGTPIYIHLLPSNLGRSKTRNIGIQKGWHHTHIFAFLDSDDKYLPGKISKSVIKILEDPSAIGIVYSDFRTNNYSNGIIQEEFKGPFDIFQLHRNNIINNDSLITRLALEQCGIYDEAMEVAEDWDLMLRITRNFMAIHIPEILIEVGVTPNNATASVSNFVWQKNFQLISSRIQAGVY